MAENIKGLELSRRYYEEYGKPMLIEKFGSELDLLAVGLTGSGSECFGYDDGISQDHDFEPGFCIFIPDEDIIDEKTAFIMQREYDKLPSEYSGFSRKIMSPVGGRRRGVVRIGDFFKDRCGNGEGELSIYDWLMVPEYSLAEAVNGEIFFDNFGKLSEIRERIKTYPEDIRLKKMAGYILTMAQSGQYNYRRCISRGETAAAQLSIFKFVEAAVHVIFLINRQYMPYYKWVFRALTGLRKFNNLTDSLEFLISSDNDGKRAAVKLEMIEDIAALVIKEIMEEGISLVSCLDLEKHAYSVNDHITDVNLRNMDIFTGV